MNITFIDFFVLSSLAQGLFVGFSILSSGFFKSKTNRYLGIAIFTLVNIVFFSWLDPADGILDFIRGIMWEFLFPVTLFQFFIHSIDHRFSKS